MIRRTLMRQAYNKGKWEKARNYAFKIINQPKEQQLARSVIIRSYWNQANTAEVIRLNFLWSDEFPELAFKAKCAFENRLSLHSKSHHPRILKTHNDQPRPKNDKKEWNNEDIADNFWQEGLRIWMIHTHYGLCNNLILSLKYPN